MILMLFAPFPLAQDQRSTALPMRLGAPCPAPPLLSRAQRALRRG
jgi:hypothetical protein